MDRDEQQRLNGEIREDDEPRAEVHTDDGARQSASAGPGRETTTPDSEETLAFDALEAERARSAEYLDQAQRARAELVNYRRRVEQEMEQVRKHAGERLIMRLLPVLDDFHRAIESVPAEERQDSWVQGMLLIERKLWSILESEGVRPIEAVGKPFDPAVHEAVTVDDNSGRADTVVEEFQRGYTLHDRVIRPSMVKVGSGDGRSEDGR